MFLSLFQINFTEAALFLQGTATVYSKKVEFLWQSVLKMLELLASKKALDEVDGTDGTGKFNKILVLRLVLVSVN